MGTIIKLISNLITTAFGIIFIPLSLFVLVVMPFMAISDGVKIISTGYSVNNEYLTLMIAVLVLTYISLRFRNLRRIYALFPSMFEFLKYLIIADCFISVGAELLNYSHTTLNPTIQKLGIAVFIASFILWRIFAAIYYSKKPIVAFNASNKERMQNYSKEA
jgi:hypothetical protein